MENEVCDKYYYVICCCYVSVTLQWCQLCYFRATTHCGCSDCRNGSFTQLKQ